jgi:hypothetical protein
MELSFCETAVVAAKAVLSNDLEINTHQALAQGRATLEKFKDCRTMLGYDIETESEAISRENMPADKEALMIKRMNSDKEDLHILDAAVECPIGQ